MAAVIPEIPQTIKMTVGDEERVFTTPKIHIKDTSDADTIWVPAQAMDLKEKTITANGTYIATVDDNCGGYSRAVVQVPGGTHYRVTLRHGVYMEDHSVPEYGGCVFNMLPDIAQRNSGNITGNPAYLSANPRNVTSDMDITLTSKALNPTEITDSWETLIANPSAYDIGQYKVWDFGDISFNYPGCRDGVATLYFHDFKLRKVGQFEHPRADGNGYAVSTWCFDEVPGQDYKYYWISNNSDYATGWGWGEDPDYSRGYYNMRLLINNYLYNNFPSVLKNAIVPVMNKSTLFTAGVAMNDAITVDHLWMPNWAENTRYCRTFLGNNDRKRRSYSSKSYFTRDIRLDTAIGGYGYDWHGMSYNGQENYQSAGNEIYGINFPLAFCL